MTPQTLGAGVGGYQRRRTAPATRVEYRGWIYRDLLRTGSISSPRASEPDTSLPFAGSNVPEFIELLDGSGVVTQRLRLIVNQVGTVQAVVDASTGAILQRLEHDEFGRVLFDSNPGLQPFGSAGGLVDADSIL